MAAAGSAGAAVQVGIGDQASESLTDPRFTALGIKTARIVLPWNIIDTDPWRLFTWVVTAERQGIEPYVALGKAASDRCPASPCVLPSDDEYRAAFKELHAHYPSIRVFTAWNEPNHAREPTAYDPGAAAHYADIVAEECPACTVVAGDVLDGPGMIAYLDFYKAALTSKPAVWGLHNYYDTTYFRSTGTDAFLADVAGPVWLSESGGIVTWRSSDGQVQLTYDEQRAASSLSFGLGLAAGRASRIQRMYVYQWRPGPADDFDAGLVSPDGRARPALGVLQRALGLPADPIAALGEPQVAGDLVAPPAPPSARVTFGAVTIRHGRIVRVRLSCSGARCRGRVTLSGTGRIAEQLVNGRTRRGTLAPRRRAFDLAAGARTVMRMRIPKPVVTRASRGRAGARVTAAPVVAGEFTPVVRTMRFPRSLQTRR